eukprot:TRINITY_DN9126_c0_g1_i1.p1 TRINITY_DN9126_c0_g1~~TRINITY_DN9126_c0_g1_i1.p1  ORF type:complete len:1266 (+),score=278.91 TRINITY_DN9126_c0_g1_i1:85-3882(+)
MAVAFESFSIREYASRMRSVDARKSWPFKENEEDPKKEKTQGLLPPIVCRKYRWWSNELENERRKVGQDEEMEKDVENICGLGLEKLRIDELEDDVVKVDEDLTAMCGTFTATTINAVNVHINGCLVQASREERREMRAKAKTRAPKKRSIVEIFAVAPQIERLDDEEDDNLDGEEEEDGLDLGMNKGSLLNVVSKLKRKKGKLKKRKVKKEIEINDTSIKKKKNKKKKKKKVAIDKKKLHKMKKERIGILAMSNGLGAKKEKFLKLMTVPFGLGDTQLRQGSLHNQRPGKEIADLVHKQKKKKSKVKKLPKKNQLQIVKTSKLLCKMQEPPVFALHSILKNHSRVTSVQKSTESGNLQGSNLAKHHSLQHSGKHVRFLGEDEVIGHASKQCTSELPLSVKELSVESDEAEEENGSDEDASLSIGDDREAQSLHENKQWTDPHGLFVPSATGSDNSNRDLGKTSLGVDLNQALHNSDSLHLFNMSSSVSPHNLSCIPKTLSYFSDGATFEENQAEGRLQRSPNTNTRMSDPFAYPNPRSAAMNSVTNMTRNSTSQALLASSMANVERNEEQPNLQPATRKNYNGSTLHYTKDLIGSDCSSSVELSRFNRQPVCENRHFGEPGAIPYPLSVCRDKWVDEDFVGLPLNSHGELIQLHSSGKVGYSHIFKKQNRSAASVSTLPMHYNLAGTRTQMDHPNKHFVTELPSLRWFSEQNHLKENPAAPVPSRPGFTKSQTFVTEINVHDKMREADHFSHELDSDLDLVNIPSHGHRKYGQPHNHVEKEMTLANSDYAFPPTQPTMRLMGKNVTIGKSSIQGQGFDDVKVWTDKETIAENHPDVTISGRSRLKPCFQNDWIACSASGASKENMFDSVEAEKNHKPPSLLRMTSSVEPKFVNATHLVSVDGRPLIGGNHGAEFWPSTQTFPSRSLLNEASISRTESVKAAHQIPMRISDAHNSHLQNVMLKSSQFRQNSSVAYNPPSDFKLTFPNEDSGEYMQPSRVHCSSLDLHPWLQNGTQRKEILYTSHPCDFIGKHQPFMRPSSNVLSFPSPYAIPPISLRGHNTDPSHLCLQNSSAQVSLVHHPSLLPAIPGFRPSSSTNNRFMNMSQKSHPPCLKDPNGAKKAKKRLQPKFDEPSKLMKKPNLEMQKDLNSLSGLNKREHVPAYTQYNTGTPEFHIHNDKSVDTVIPMEIENDGYAIASGDNAFQLDGVARLGPIKLSAGAKHILRPSQNTDQDKGRPTHSTIRFTAVDDSCKVPEFQEKTAKIYRF